MAEKIKFKYTTEYQWDLLRFITIDKLGYKALTKVKDHYFTLIEHQILAFCLIKYYTKNHKIPGETLLREEVVKVLNSKDYVDLVTKSEQTEIVKLIPQLYSGILRDGDEIYNMCKKFSAYVRLTDLLEEMDPTDWDQYTLYAHKFYNVIEDEDEQEERKISYLFDNLRERQFRRQEKVTYIPTPFKQINDLTNAGGFEKGAMIVLLDKEKKGKTMALVNIAKGYIRRGKKVLYLDFENGMDSILIRFEQSIMGMDKRTILDGEVDQNVQKKFRKYKRLKGEAVVVRMAAGSNANDVQRIIDQHYREHGTRFDVIVGDYLAKAGSLSKKKDDTERISDVYEDFANLVMKNDYDALWTANHVTREGAKLRLRSKYQSTDIAKCIDIVRHVHAIFGLNRSVEEEDAGIVRMEVVEMRDGVHGRAVFSFDPSLQQMTEFTKAQRIDYDENFAPSLLEEEGSGEKEDKPSPRRQKAMDKASSDFN